MKSVFIIILILISFLFYPQFNEGTDSSCASLERQVLRVVTENKEDSIFLGLLFKGFSNGAFAQEMVKSKYPKLPPMIGCSIFYYDVMLNPERVLNLKANL
jgi:hypothetical protein